MANSLGDLSARLTRDLAIDLGSTNTRVFVRGRGIAVDEPSVVARQRGEPGVLAVGEEARAMLGRTPDSIAASRPLRDGGIADFKGTEALVRAFIAKALGGLGSRGWMKPRIAVCVPAGLTDAEQHSVQESVRAAGAREVALVPSVLAAALGAGLPLMEPRGTMVLDLGGGTTEVAIFALGGIVQARVLKVGGMQLDAAIQAHVQEQHGLLIGQQTAEAAKIEAGAAVSSRRPRRALVRGRDAQTGIPRQVELTGEELRAAVQPLLDQVLEAVRETLAKTPPELAGDILDSGIVLTGGGARLYGMERMLRDVTQLPCVVAEASMHCAARGAGEALDHPELLERIALF